jgi:hypothetical protein
MINKFKQSTFVKTTASPKLTVICLLILVILVVWGTVYQASHGLYLAQQKFFNSWYLFLFGFIPFPGTVLVMWVLFFNLISSIIFRIGFKRAKLGNLLIHIGLVVLLIGGFFTFYYAQESVLSLQEGQGSNLSQAYHSWELAVWEGTGQNRDVYAVDSDDLEQDDEVIFEGLDLKIGILAYFKNSEISFDQTSSGQMNVNNSSGIRAISNKKPEKEPTRNSPGILFKISNHAAKGSILLYGRDPRPTGLKINQKNFFFSLRKKRYFLPFYLELLDFKKKMYPGSDIARSYESQVIIRTRDFSRKVLISMNKPLRHKDFTIFQSSFFIAQNGTESSVLAVVKNSGRMFPYISSLIIFLGLLIHFLTMLFRKNKKK